MNSENEVGGKDARIKYLEEALVLQERAQTAIVMDLNGLIEDAQAEVQFVRREMATIISGTKGSTKSLVKKYWKASQEVEKATGMLARAVEAINNYQGEVMALKGHVEKLQSAMTAIAEGRAEVKIEGEGVFIRPTQKEIDRVREAHEPCACRIKPEQGESCPACGGW
jgi:uncharacterized protein YyaL (SSP411 family)